MDKPPNWTGDPSVSRAGAIPLGQSAPLTPGLDTAASLKGPENIFDGVRSISDAADKPNADARTETGAEISCSAAAETARAAGVKDIQQTTAAARSQIIAIFFMAGVKPKIE